jgi:hypothetical protein
MQVAENRGLAGHCVDALRAALAAPGAGCCNFPFVVLAATAATAALAARLAAAVAAAGAFTAIVVGAAARGFLWAARSTFAERAADAAGVTGAAALLLRAALTLRLGTPPKRGECRGRAARGVGSAARAAT